jgi:hypothetical protein
MRVPDIVSKSVAFVMYRKKGSQELTCAGTCFLVQYALATPGRAMQYIVTAQHVIAQIQKYSDDGIVLVRANRLEGDITHIHSHCSNWLRHPTDSSVDVAVCQWQPHDKSESEEKLALMDLIPFSVDLFATADKLKEYDIGIGDEVFCIGLFSPFIGSAKNMPIVRMGAIALVPNEPIPTRKFGNIEALLIEIRSSGGLSGSPVFLYYSGHRLFHGTVVHQGFFLMLGLIHGHWDIPEGALDIDVPFEDEKLNSGIAVVIPAQKLAEVFEHPRLKRVRAEVEQFGKTSLHLAPLE